MGHEEALQTLSAGVSLAGTVAITGLTIKATQKALSPRRYNNRRGRGQRNLLRML